MKPEVQLSVAEYKDHFTQLLREVEKGQRHLITRHGQPIARVTPPAAGRDIAETIASIRANRVQGRRDLKALMQRGRR
jgi:prevent-host-death family protein